MQFCGSAPVSPTLDGNKMLLRDDLVNDAIYGKRVLGKLISSKAGSILDHCVVRDYFLRDQIPEVTTNKESSAPAVASFFEKHLFLRSVEIDDLLRKLEGGNERDRLFARWYLEKKAFPFKYKIHVFDTFLLAEIVLDTALSEFVVISTPLEEGNELVQGLKDAKLFFELATAMLSDPRLQITLFTKIGDLLEYLRTGIGRKKLFGIF